MMIILAVYSLKTTKFFLTKYISDNIKCNLYCIKFCHSFNIKRVINIAN